MPADPPEPKSAAEAYNRIFELLVDDGDDPITGYVAYALYKQKKRDWIRDFKSRKGISPTDGELDEYTRAEALPRNITTLRREAQAILAEYAAAITEVQYAELSERVVERAVVSEVKSTLQSVERQGNFWNQVKVTCFSTFFTTIILIVLSIAIALFGVDILNGAQKLRQSLGS